MQVRSKFIILLSAFALSACGNVDGANLIFGQKHSVGLSISASTTSQDAELSLGYKDTDIAVVPVAVKNKDGTFDKIAGSIVPGNTDSLSVLGQFALSGGTEKGPTVGLGKFFATGAAAQVLAQGFADKLAGGAPAP